MSNNTTLTNVKNALGITGNYQDNTLTVYIDEVKEFIVNSGVKSQNITDGLIARGVCDLWNYGANDGKLSPYFYQRVTQLAYK